jgi:hypothetical protein
MVTPDFTKTRAPNVLTVAETLELIEKGWLPKQAHPCPYCHMAGCATCEGTGALLNLWSLAEQRQVWGVHNPRHGVTGSATFYMNLKDEVYGEPRAEITIRSGGGAVATAVFAWNEIAGLLAALAQAFDPHGDHFVRKEFMAEVVVAGPAVLYYDPKRSMTHTYPNGDWCRAEQSLRSAGFEEQANALGYYWQGFK